MRPLPSHRRNLFGPPSRAGRSTLLIGLACVLVGLVSVTRAAAQDFTIGGVPVIASWRVEPALVNQANAIVVTIDAGANGQPPDLAMLSASIVYGGIETAVELAPTETGEWSAEFTPPQVGAYALRLSGAVSGETIDLTLPLGDVRSTTLSLPAIQSDAPHVPGQAAPQTNWLMILGFAAAALMLVAAVLIGRPKR
jgi:hypothetical protein